MKKQTMKLASVIAIFCICLLGSGCTDATRNKLSAFGQPHKIEMYSGGQKVREWFSTGYVRSEENSDGYFFTERDTGDLVKVIGDCVITTLD